MLELLFRCSTHEPLQFQNSVAAMFSLAAYPNPEDPHAQLLVGVPYTPQDNDTLAYLIQYQQRSESVPLAGLGPCHGKLIVVYAESLVLTAEHVHDVRFPGYYE